MKVIDIKKTRDRNAICNVSLIEKTPVIFEFFYYTLCCLFIYRQDISSQVRKMDVTERLRRLKRSFEANLSFRKTVILVCFALGFLLYFGPHFMSWLFGYETKMRISGPSCVGDKIIQHSADLQADNAHVRHQPSRPDDSTFLPYIGNGHFGLAMSEESKSLFIPSAGPTRSLSVPVSFQPLVHLSNSERESYQTAQVTNYLKGLVHDVTCFADDGSNSDISASQQIYAHRAIPEVLVQDIKIHNPSGQDQYFRMERQGITNWPTSSSTERRIEHGDGNKKYAIISGIVSIPSDSMLSIATNDQVHRMVTIVVPKIEENVAVKARMTNTFTFLSAISYSKPMTKELAKEQKEATANEAISAIMKAAGRSNQSLKEEHLTIWKSLWTTGFGISHSMADEAVNGVKVNATIYYVLSQTPTPLHSVHPVDVARRNELQSSLAYLEGCYGGLPTLQATNLWKSLDSQDEVNRLVSLWLLTLYKNVS